MNDEATPPPLEPVLLRCRAAAPDPWFPDESFGSGGVLDRALEDLWLEGLIQPAGRLAGGGPGFRLTPLGERTLAEPAMLDRLRHGRPLLPGDPAAEVRHSLRVPRRAWLTRVILAANLLFFAYGAFLAYRHGWPVVNAFLTGGMGGGAGRDVQFALSEVLHANGSVSSADVMRGQPWRLMTAAFCHLGLLHLGMNMLMLRGAGTAVEQRWGWWRFLIIYLLGAWGGSCLAVSRDPRGLVGASGALCGVLAAEGVWAVLAGRYLPPSLARRGRRQVFGNVILLVVISLVPGVSGWGHLGGGVGGLLAALALYGLRFGPRPVRPLAVLALLGLPFLGWGLIVQARATPAWEAARARDREYRRQGKALKGDREAEAFEGAELQVMGRALRAGRESWIKEVVPLLDRHPTRRDPDRVRDALAALAARRAELRELADRLDSEGSSADPTVEAARVAGHAYAVALERLFDTAAECLQAGSGWKGPREMELRERRAEAEARRRDWLGLLE